MSEILGKFTPWTGSPPVGFYAEFLGVITDSEFEVLPEDVDRRKMVVRTYYIPVDNEYFELLDLLEAVDEARDKFTMIELVLRTASSMI